MLPGPFVGQQPVGPSVLLNNRYVPERLCCDCMRRRCANSESLVTNSCKPGDGHLVVGTKAGQTGQKQDGQKQTKADKSRTGQKQDRTKAGQGQKQDKDKSRTRTKAGQGQKQDKSRTGQKQDRAKAGQTGKSRTGKSRTGRAKAGQTNMTLKQADSFQR
jgi:hypothetical protein